jgi:hypothetical protein
MGNSLRAVEAVEAASSTTEVSYFTSNDKASIGGGKLPLLALNYGQGCLVAIVPVSIQVVPQ